jgi:hypothetical protein
MNFPSNFVAAFSSPPLHLCYHSSGSPQVKMDVAMKSWGKKALLFV